MRTAQGRGWVIKVGRRGGRLHIKIIYFSSWKLEWWANTVMAKAGRGALTLFLENFPPWFIWGQESHRMEQQFHPVLPVWACRRVYSVTWLLTLVSDFPTGWGSGGCMWGFWPYPCLPPIYTSRPPSCPLLFTHGSCQANFSPTRDCASSTKVRTGLLDPPVHTGPRGPT